MRKFFGLAFGFIVVFSSCNEEVANSSKDCGDGVVDVGEECDTNDFSGRSCMTEGFYEGQLLCTSDCKINDASCTGYCGDGVFQGGDEECEGEDLNSTNCHDLGFSSGTLSCADDCTFDRSLCVARCGDGEISEGAGEQCEGENLNEQSCVSLGYYGGQLTCDENCKFLEGDCITEGFCGDGNIQSAYGEECDTNSLGNASCASLSQDDVYYGEGLACDEECQFVLTGCGHCGDGILHDTFGESCDGTNLGTATCASATGDSSSTGTLSCDGACDFDTSGCSFCGNNTIESTEQCDGTDLGTATCADVGLLHGTPTCTGCVVSYASCHTTVFWGSAANDTGWRISVPASGEVFVTGVTNGYIASANSGGTDLFHSRFSALGNLVESFQMGTSSSELGRGGYTSGTHGYFAGHGTGGVDGSAGTGKDGVLVRYDLANSSNMSIVEIDSDDHADDNIWHLAPVSGSTDLILAGSTFGYFDTAANAGSSDIVVHRFSATGTRLWSTQMGGAGYDIAFAVTSDPSGNIIECGELTTTSNGYDIHVAKLNGSTGAVVWAHTYGGAANDVPYACVTDASGAIYVAGYSEGALNGNAHLGGRDLFVMKLDPDGAHQWTMQHGSANDDYAQAMVLSNGYLYVGGYTNGSTLEGIAAHGGYDGFIMTFTLDGTLEETRLYGNSGDNSIYDLAVTPEGNIAATGPSQGGFNDQTAPGGAVDAFYLIVPPSFP